MVKNNKLHARNLALYCDPSHQNLWHQCDEVYLWIWCNSLSIYWNW